MNAANESPTGDDDLDDPMVCRAYLQTSLDCDGCETHFASPPADGEATEDAVLRWAVEVTPVAKGKGWIAYEGGAPLYCPDCATSREIHAYI